MKKALILAALFTASNLLKAQSPGIPFKRYRLPNGLTILLQQDLSNPKVQVDLAYKVGSAQDPEGRSGMAHFFEHLMFKGSKHVNDGEHTKMLAACGGTANAQTFQDYTMFTNTAPGNALEQVLWLEADRMGWWLNTFDQNKFETQRKVIIDEQLQNTGNSTFAQLNQLADMIYFPANYPYRRPTGGFADDIRSIGFDDAIAFYRKYYQPSNAILCIGGNFREEQALGWVRKYFGPIPSAKSRTSEEPRKYPSSGIDTTITVADTRIDHAWLYIKFPSAKKYDPDYAAMECIGRLLGGDADAWLPASRKDLPDASVIAFNNSLRLAGTFSIIVSARPGTDLTSAKTALFKRLHDFSDMPDTLLTALIQRYKKWIVFRKLLETETMEGRLYNLAAYETCLGRADLFPREMSSYEKLTAHQIKTVFRRYLLNSPKMIAFADHNVDRSDLRDFYTQQESMQQAKRRLPTQWMKQPASAKEANEPFDRSRRPALDTTQFAFVQGKDCWQQELPNGIKVIGQVEPASQIISIDVYRKGLGISADALRELAYLLQTCPSQRYSSGELSRMINSCGAYYYIGTDDNVLYIQLKCLSQYLDTALVWLREKLLFPVITDSDCRLVKTRRYHDKLSAVSDINAIADQAFKALGPDPAFEWPDTSFTRIAGNLSTEQAGSILASPDQGKLDIICYGPMTSADFSKRCHFFNDWKQRTPVANLPMPPPRLPDSPGIYCYNVKGASQIAIRCGYYIDQPLDYDKDLCKLSFANYIFGGFFNSRLNTDLREQKGYTYRAFSYLTGNPAYSSFSIELAVPSADLAGALPEIIRQVDSFSRAGLSQTEIAFLKKAFSFSNPLLKEFYYDKMKFLQLLADDEIPENVDQQQHRLMNRLTGEELNAVISRLIDPSRFRIILVGDQSDIEQGLTRLTAGTADGSIALGNYRFHVYAK